MSKFKLFSCCIPVKGNKRTVLCDIQRNEFYFIPPMLFDVIVENQEIDLHTIEIKYPNESGNIKLQLDELVKLQMGFWTENPETFPPLSMEWEMPSSICNAIIEYSNSLKINYRNIL